MASAPTYNGKPPLRLERGGAEETPLLPPRDVHAEAAVLGAALTNQESAAALSNYLSASDFYLSAHRKVFGGVTALLGAGEPVDMLGVVRAIKPRNSEEESEWRELVSQLVDVRCIPSIPEMVEHHAKPIKEKARLRDLWEVSESISTCIKGADSAEDAFTQAAELLQQYERRGQSAATHSFGFKASWLQHEPFAEIRWAIKGLLPEGLCVLGGRPKQGKSWWALQAAAAIARGIKAFSKIDTEQGPVLYLGLEDSQRRLQKRLQLLLGKEAWPEALLLNTKWPRLAEGGLGKLARYFREQQPRLVVIDTFARVRDASDPRANAYDSDTSALAPLQQLAMDHHVCVLLILHLRKLPSDDWIDAIAGSTGLSGVPDALLGLFRKRGERGAELKVTGRDIDERELAYRLDERAFWVEEGPAEEVARTYEQRQVCITIARAKRSLQPADIAKRLGISLPAAQQRLYRMADQGLLRSADGYYDNLPGYELPENDAFPVSYVNGVSPVNSVSPVNGVETVSLAAPEADTGYFDSLLADSPDNADIADRVDIADSNYEILPDLIFPIGMNREERDTRQRTWRLAQILRFPRLREPMSTTGGSNWYSTYCLDASLSDVEGVLGALERLAP